MDRHNQTHYREKEPSDDATIDTLEKRKVMNVVQSCRCIYGNKGSPHAYKKLN